MSNVLAVGDLNHSDNDWEDHILCASNTDIIKFLECVKDCSGILAGFSEAYTWEEKLKVSISWLALANNEDIIDEVLVLPLNRKKWPFDNRGRAFQNFSPN